MHPLGNNAAKLLQSCPTLCDPVDGSPPGSPIPRLLQARTLEWVAISFSNVGKWKVKVKSLSRVRLLATSWTACSPPGSSIHGIFQAGVLEGGAITFSEGSPEVYIYSFFAGFPSHLGHHGPLSRVLWALKYWGILVVFGNIQQPEEFLKILFQTCFFQCKFPAFILSQLCS